MTDDYLSKLIDDHWEYVEGILRAHALEDPDIDLAKYHYKTAFKHGYKHAMNDAASSRLCGEDDVAGPVPYWGKSEDFYP